ncbi:Hypothetical predicted protein [Olea europaea subsp. europaea]|uniref:Uncharacterized protein n=1 Tax=Olea europaea subsp. europaea TaxID=158383 RepID=A0A8S0PG78_OLEEU|nr:Hypothetical predicted protein [Olea europaea subsp. europaea]
MLMISFCFSCRDRSRNDTLAVVRDRKVKASDSASLYTLCRSWLRNGIPEEIQPLYLDTVKSLPRPFPIKKRKMRMRDLLSIYLQRSSCKDMSSILREFGHD